MVVWLRVEVCDKVVVAAIMLGSKLKVVVELSVLVLLKVVSKGTEVVSLMVSVKLIMAVWTRGTVCSTVAS